VTGNAKRSVITGGHLPFHPPRLPLIEVFRGGLSIPICLRPGRRRTARCSGRRLRAGHCPPEVSRPLSHQHQKQSKDGCRNHKPRNHARDITSFGQRIVSLSSEVDATTQRINGSHWANVPAQSCADGGDGMSTLCLSPLILNIANSRSG
jgi:hypothetical protein